MTKEQKFYDTLRDVFVGVKVEGQGGFINLMRIKSNYYKQIESLLKEDVEKALDEHPSFRDELFDKLYSFFYRYFTQNGSIYFNDTIFHNDVYERVYTGEKDVILFWKTQMLYYVKTDVLYQSMPIEFDGLRFNFDASHIRNGQANEKKELIFSLRKVKNEEMVFDIAYSKNGSKMNEGDILKKLKGEGVSITKEQLIKAFNIFERQTEMDFFINKNAKAFLQEQFKLWSYQYFWDGAKGWDAARVNQLQILKAIAFKIIDFISQFEDELVKIWNKPKFVKNSNYVISLDRLSDELVNKVKQAKGYKEQVKEWEALGIDPKNPKAPIDTRYFKDLELSILAQFDNLDEELDGWLIKSENYQALNTILPKFKEKVQCIYIDPPFNTGEDFPYVDKFRISSWLSLMRDRISLGKEFLANTGNYFLHLDKNAIHLGRSMLDTIMGESSFKNEIIWGYEKPRTAKNKFKENHDNILFFAKNIKESIFNIQHISKKDNNGLKMLGDWWSDIPSYSTIMSAKERTYFESQKPEKLLQRIIQASMPSEGKSIILDFFLGSGTTIAVANKLKKKWIGIEIGDQFFNFYEDVITIDKSGEDSKIDKEKIKFKVLEILGERGDQLKLRVSKYGALGKLKMVISADSHREPTKLSRDINWQGGGFFKYYELEQYEETLDKCKYEDSDLFIQTNKSDYEQYVFLPDEKMLTSLELDYDNNKVKVDLSKLYDNIDIAETLSNLTGKWIKAIRENQVEFTDGTSINTKDLDYKKIKPLIWWE